MTSIKTFAWGGIAVAIAALLSLATLSTTVQAALPTVVNVILSEEIVAPGAAATQAGGGVSHTLDDDDIITANADSATAVLVVVEVDDNDAGADANNANETIVTLTTTVGTWANGQTTIQVQCANTADAVAGVTVDDNDAPDADPLPVNDDGDAATESNSLVGITEAAFTGLTNSTADAEVDDDDADNAVNGCWGVAETLLVPAGVAAGTYQITASTTNNVTDVDNLVINAAIGTTATAIAQTSQGHDAIGYTATGYTPWVNGSLWTVRLTDANGNGVNGKQVSFTTDNGKLAADPSVAPATPNEAAINAACANPNNLGKQVIATSNTFGTTSTNTGRARVIACGDAAAAGKTMKLTATVTGQGSLTLTDEITVSAEPVATDIVVTVTGSTINVSVMPGGVPAPDRTVVLFAPVPNDSAAVANACVMLDDGKASNAVAVAGGTVAQVLVSIENRTEVTAGENNNCNDATQEAWGSISALIGSPTPTVVPTGTATGTATPSGPGTITGDKPPASGGGIGLFVFNGGTNAQLVTASGCNAATASFYVTSGGVFVTYVPGTSITAVNADWNAKFPGGNIPANTPIMGKCA